jgi:hypothetical protein
MAGGDELSEERVNIVAVGVDTIPDGDNDAVKKARGDAQQR